MSSTSTVCPFIWYELLTTDSAAATTFYGKVLGWTAKDSGMPGGAYTLVSVGTVNVGGVMTLSPAACSGGARPGWLHYVGVPNVDACVEQIKAAGGALHMGPEDIPGIGRFAMVADPHGAPFYVMTPISNEPPPEVAPGAVGHVGWCELHAGNLDEAFRFHSGLFGWTKTEAMDMGPMGIYQLFAAGGDSIGGMMTKMADSPVPHWMYYFGVEAIDAGIARVREAGGMILMDAHQVPGGTWISVCSDPQGAVFGILADRR